VPCLATIATASFEEVAQLTVNGVISGSSYALLGIGFGLILGVVRRFHFAYALTYMLSAYVAAVLMEEYELPFLAAAGMGLSVGVAIAVLIEAGVYARLARQSGDAALLPIFVASLGLTIAGENITRLIWGSRSRPLTGIDIEGISVGDVTFTSLDVIAVTTAVVLVGVTTLLLRRTNMGRQIRAVRDNPEMASAVGIRIERVHLFVFTTGTVLAGVAALFAGLKFAVAPDMGIRPVFVALVVASLAGVHRSPLLIGTVGLGVGTVESLSTLWLSPKWSSLVVFALLFLYLSYRSVRLAVARHWGGHALRRRVLQRAVHGA
jgi:branched-chain amino acid transport system permease protein